LTGWILLRTRNVSPVRYELGSYIPEDGIPHSHRKENLKSYRYVRSPVLVSVAYQNCKIMDLSINRT
jgi:hypothetical protein